MGYSPTEPSLRRDFREHCAEAKRVGLIVGATSHGQMIPSNPALVDFLDELVISMDAPRKEINDSLRGEGSFEASV